MTQPLLQGKTALITGAARGIGLAIGRAYAEHGARVILADLDKAQTQAAASDLPDARGIGLDVVDEAATEAAFDQLSAEGWSPDVVVPNAGILHLEPIDSFPADRFRSVVEVNLTGAFLTARAAARRMLADGRIILTSSLFGIRGGAQNAAYASSKFGMVGLAQSMAADLAPRGILVNAVAPGQIQTEMMDKLVADRLAMGMADPRDRLLSRIPLGRLGRPEEVTGAYVWLASPLATYVTGQTIVVDGGWQVG
jgi:NAD(P)-dependent dehydrogenase (short-subunit alcohol dehydrogenase family)